MCWRRDLDSMQKRMVAAMNNNIPDICHDVKYLVGQDEVEISCHKIFLIIASPVFQAMFSHRHNTQEIPINGFTDECTTIIIPDVQPNRLKNLIKYSYTGILNVDADDLTPTMRAAHKYDIPELTQYCSQILYQNLSEENAVTAYQAALLLDDENLHRKSWEFIEKNAVALLDSDQFLDFSEENLRRFLGLDFMPYLKSEVDAGLSSS